MITSKVQKLAIAKGWPTRQELAKGSGVNWVTCNKYWEVKSEMGKITLGIQLRLAAALGCEPQDLYEIGE